MLNPRLLLSNRKLNKNKKLKRRRQLQKRKWKSSNKTTKWTIIPLRKKKNNPSSLMLQLNNCLNKWCQKITKRQRL